MRHAFGSYRDVLREVSYSPMMASYLTFLKNKAIAFGSYPDENYAREVMQLFSIGLYRLNPDGTPSPHTLPAYMWVPRYYLGIARVHAHCARPLCRHTVSRRDGRDGGHLHQR